MQLVRPLLRRPIDCLQKIFSKQKYNNRRVNLDFPECFRAEFPEIFDSAMAVTELCIDLIKDVSLDSLADHSPGLKGFDWTVYLRASIIRMLELGNALLKHVPQGSKILDYGSYFGNYSMFLRDLGYEVDAIDDYRDYGACFEKNTKAMRDRGVVIKEFSDHTYDLNDLEAQYDALICFGVIEHVPHTPRLMLTAQKNALKPGGMLVIETPNLAYIYNRQKLSRGESIFCPIEKQFETRLPFMGHHREYTPGEIKWMLEKVGCEIVVTIMFSYGLYSLPYLSGIDLENFQAMLGDPSLREIIMVLANKPY